MNKVIDSAVASEPPPPPGTRAKRTYDMTRRKRAAANTRARILEASVNLWRNVDFEGITLNAVAREAGVSLQTVLRHFGSKRGLFVAAIESGVSGIEEERDQIEAGDIQAAIEGLMVHYERDGEATLRTLAAEQRFEEARLVTAHGRRRHRAWNSRVFAPWLPETEAPDYEESLDAFVAATDIYLWKLLRRDCGRSAKRTRDTLFALVQALCLSAEVSFAEGGSAEAAKKDSR